jgi:hypothetical protein
MRAGLAEKKKTFRATLFRYPGPGGWTFARIPENRAPPATHPWGRTPVRASVDGQEWETSVWRDKTHGTLLPVPRRLLGKKGDGDVVSVALWPRDP